MQIRIPSIVLAMLAAWSGAAAAALADSGKPVAVRWWGQGMVSIETYWNLAIVIDPYSEKIGYDDPQLAGDLVLVSHEHFDHNNVAAVQGEPTVVRGLDAEGRVVPSRGTLDRLPNADRASWRAADPPAINSLHGVVVSVVSAWHDDAEGKDRGATAMFVVDVDGVRIVHCGDLGQRQLTAEQLQALGRVDVLLIPVGGKYTVDGPQAADIVRQVKPRTVVPIHYKTEPLAIGLDPVDGFLGALGKDAEIVRPLGNTLAVSSAARTSAAVQGEQVRVVVLDYRPWKPTGELAELFGRMEQACADSQAVFAPLSAEQMNFRPGNGTHTPRWNAEHMMGRELLFFTEIYAQKDPAITPLDLNPQQMPPDYKPAHPEWTGAEEARQMERVSALVRRFAYLLEGVPLDAPAPGSRWRLRGLLEQMERHYGEHTANVMKKFELPDWPAS